MDLDYIRSRLSYDEVTGLFTWLPVSIREGKWRRHDLAWNSRYAGKIAGSPHNGGYISIRIVDQNGVKLHLLAHRLAWFYVTGEWAENDIDHINRDRTHNYFSNLRRAKRFQNNANTGLPRHNTSGVKGVYWNARDKRWVAQIGMNNTVKPLGYYQNMDDAIAARKTAEIAYFGEFAA